MMRHSFPPPLASSRAALWLVAVLLLGGRGLGADRPNVLFVGAYVDGELAASGAAKLMDDDSDYAEIKRVFVLERFRGLGLSSRLMHHLESELRGRGVELFRLETGVRQPEALGLYRKLGYLERGPFGSYRPDPLSVFMEKRVTR